MPIFLLPLIASGLFGAFVGSQIDDSIDQPPQGVPATQALNINQIAYYAAIGMGLFWLAHKSGVLKGK